MKKKSLLFLPVIVLLCILFIKPDPFSKLVSSVETSKENKVHSEWKTEAKKSGAELYSYEDNIYYAQPSQDNIIPVVGNRLAYVNNEVVVYFKDNTKIKDKQEVFDSVDAQVVGYTDILNKYQLRLQSEKSWVDLQSLCTSLRRQKSVVYAGLNLATHLTPDEVPDDPWLEPNSSYSAINDWDESSVSGGNWWLKATQTVSAWDYASYFHPICVGILDSGFETTHEDLQEKISFPSSFYESTNRPSSHGVHVSGIVSANANNKIGTTGICNQAQLMCVDWEPEGEDQYWSTNERIFTGVIALVKSGAKVINLSLGSSGGFDNQDLFWWNLSMNVEGALFSFMIASLLSRGYDFLVVQSAGNGGQDDLPCDSFYNGSFCSITKKNAFTGLTGISKQTVLDHVLVVGSCTSAHDGTEFYQSSFSNYGNGVTIFAPGSHVFSTDLMSNGGYSYKSGTSMAAPVVTAIAALTWSVNPDLSGDQVKAILCDPQNTTYTCKNYYNDTLDIPSYSMINAKLSVEAAIRTLPQQEETTGESPEHVTQTIPYADAMRARRETPQLGKSDQIIIYSYRNEKGE